MNPPKGMPHKYLPGVSKRKGVKRFRSGTTRNGEVITIGYYDTEQEAHEAYVRYNKEYPVDHSGKGKIPPPPTPQRKINADLIGTIWQGL